MIRRLLSKKERDSDQSRKLVCIHNISSSITLASWLPPTPFLWNLYSLSRGPFKISILESMHSSYMHSHPDRLKSAPGKHWDQIRQRGKGQAANPAQKRGKCTKEWDWHMFVPENQLYPNQFANSNRSGKKGANQNHTLNC